MGRPKVKIKAICPICKSEFETYPSYPRKTCSKKCMGINQRGKNNPNFGNKWNSKQKKKLSDYNKGIRDEISKRVSVDWDDNTSRRNDASKTMKKNKVWEKSTFKRHSRKSKKLIGKKSREKFTPEFKKKQRETMEQRGHWLPLNEKSDYEIYYNEANWVDKMFNLVDNGIDMLNEHGIFHVKENNNGVVRDHIMGRKYGFKHKIFPEIIRHPCNCQILRQRDNVSKGQRGRGRPDTDISIDDLFSTIKNYKGKWFEHQGVLDLINDYENGKRWQRATGGNV